MAIFKIDFHNFGVRVIYHTALSQNNPLKCKSEMAHLVICV